MNIRRQLLISFSLPLFVGCVSWPKEGRGGFAEHKNENLISVEYKHAMNTRHGLRFDYTLLKNQLSVLKLQGSYYCYPAATDRAETLEVRIARELSAGMFDSAEVNIIKQRLSLTELEKKLNETIRNHSCVPENMHGSRDLRNHVLALLNHDNQFATDSSELNPKYVQNINEAAELLENIRYRKIVVVGRTDSKGDSQQNFELAYKRASNVKDMLVDFGAQQNDIDVISAGQYSPRYQGTSDAVRLVNRSVSVYLLEE